LLSQILLPKESQLSIDSIEITEEMIIISVVSTNQQENCPHCQKVSHRIHSHYQRCPADLPLAGHTVRLQISVNRFFCLNDDCQRTTFAERMSALLKPYARRTKRLVQNQLQAAFVLGGEASARLLTLMGMPVSGDTLLRLIRQTPEAEVTTPRVLGVDDWAKRKGQDYGTLLVDLEKRQPVDLLDERSAASLTEWLKAHPGVEVISRDRGTEYIKGATDGAPSAIQVADRWHLLKNLREALQRLLQGKPDCLKAAAASNHKEKSTAEKQETTDVQKTTDAFGLPQPETTPTTTMISKQQSDEPSSDEPPKLTAVEKEKLAKHTKRRQRFQKVKKLKEQGFSIREISRRTKISRQTVTKYLKAETCPQYPSGIKRKSIIDPYKDYITQCLKKGLNRATQIFNQLRQKGYEGSYGTVVRTVRKEFKALKSAGAISPQQAVVPWSPSRASWLLAKPEADLTLDDKDALLRMKQSDDNVACAHTLGQRFAEMIREQKPQQLMPWLKDVADSGIDALIQFAKGIKQDFDAVLNALLFKWNNGQLEGQINRLKLIKRQMYGRANFDLLRKRVLFDPTSAFH
jgi:transposase